MFGQIVILNHPRHVQSFHKDRLVLADDPRRKFLKRVSSGIADFGVQSGYFIIHRGARNLGHTDVHIQIEIPRAKID